MERRTTIDETILAAIEAWRADYAAFNGDPLATAHPYISAALTNRLAGYVRDWLQAQRDEVVELLEADLQRAHNEVLFLESRKDESAVGALAELRTAYAILGVLAYREGGSVLFSEQDRRLSETLSVEIEHDDETGDVKITATSGNSPVGTDVGRDLEGD